MKYLILLSLLFSMNVSADDRLFVDEEKFLPYHPTAATIWPRTVQINEGEHWNPAMGRMEYLYIEETPVLMNVLNIANVVSTCNQEIVQYTPVPEPKPKKKFYKAKKKYGCK